MRTLRVVALAWGALAAICFALAPGAPLLPQDARAAALRPWQAHPPADIVVQGAVDTELQPLLSALDAREQVQMAAWSFWRGRIGGKSVVVSRTEVGPINASAATALAIVAFRPRLVVNQGTAGATDPALRVFDIVVSESAVDYGASDSEFSAPEGQRIAGEHCATFVVDLIKRLPTFPALRTIAP